MDRKDFLNIVLPTGLLTGNIAFTNPIQSPEYFPPFLKKGDTIGITSPAGSITRSELQPAIDFFNSKGFIVEVGSTIGKQEYTFGGSDEERKTDLQYMLNSKHIKAIMCARGGYGTIRIVDDLDFSAFNKNPKWVIGFSDITVLHNHIFQHSKTPSIHSKMCNSFPEDWNNADAIQKETITGIVDILTGNRLTYNIPYSPKNITGIGKGKLIGGNLRTLENLSGSKSSPTTKNAILFIEDTGEYLYSIDRMMYNLLRTDKLRYLNGLIIGGFKVKPDDEGDIFGKSLEDIILEKVNSFDFPVCFNFPVGHQKNNMPLVCGALHKLEVTTEGSVLQAIY